MFSAYTIKKMLPRLIIAVIAVNLSWYLCSALLDIANTLGGSIKSILEAPFSGLNSDFIGTLSGSQQAIIGSLFTGAAVGITIFSSWAILTPLLVGALVALLIGYVVIIIRQVMIVMLIILSPVAIALWVIPGTEGIAKKWFSFFTKLLIMYPLIIALLTSGKIVSAISNNTGNGELLPKVVAFIALFAPYFMIPFIMKFIGGALSKISGMVNDRSRGVIDGLRKRGAQKSQDNRTAARMGRRFDGNNMFAKTGNAIGFRAGRPTSVLAGVTKGRIGGKTMAQYGRNRSMEAYAAQEELYKAGVRDHDVANELATHGATGGSLRKRVQELHGQGRHGLAQRLSRVQDLSGSRYQIGAMEIAAGFGKLDDRSLRTLNDIYDKPGDLGAKEAALGSLREASKKSGNFATFASYLDQESGQVRTYTDRSGNVDEKARTKLAKALQDAGPGILGQQKQYASVDDNGTTLYDSKAAGVSAVAASAAQEFTQLAVLAGRDGSAPGPALSPSEISTRQERAIESLVQVRQTGAYTDANTKIAADRAYNEFIQGNGPLEEMYNRVEIKMRSIPQQSPGGDNQPPAGQPLGPTIVQQPAPEQTETGNPPSPGTDRTTLYDRIRDQQSDNDSDS